MNGKRVKLLCAVMVVAVSGCLPLIIGVMEPRPNVELAPAGKTLALKMGPDVIDTGSFVIHDRKSQITGFHQSLTTGFKNAFSEAFDLTPGKPADLTLEIRSTELDVSMVAMSKNASAAVGIIRYRAHLIDSSGNVVKRLGATAQSTRQAGTILTDDLNRTYGGAIEVMYEQIAAEFFNVLHPAEAPPP